METGLRSDIGNPSLVGTWARPDEGMGFHIGIPMVVNPMTQPYHHDIIDYQNQRHHTYTFNDHYNDRMTRYDGPPDKSLSNMVKHTEKSPLSEVYFSKQNLDHIQDLIVQMVSFMSDGKYQISRQDDQTILKYMYKVIHMTPNIPYGSPDVLYNEVRKLNKAVLDEVVPRVMTGIQGYLTFVRDRTYGVKPLDRPELSQSTGLKISRPISSLMI